MGIIWSYFWRAAPEASYSDTDPDPVTGLTSRDKYVLQNSWKVVKEDLTKNGIELLLLYFKKFPEDLNFFPFRDLSLEEMRTNKSFQAHCNNVIYTFSSIVDSLGDHELLVEIVRKIGNSHGKKKIPEKAFWNLKEVILELLTPVTSEGNLKIWDKALDAVLKTIIKFL